MDFSVTMPAPPGASEASNDTSSSAIIEAGNAGDASGALSYAVMEGVEEGAADDANDGEMKDDPVQRMAFVQ